MFQSMFDWLDVRTDYRRKLAPLRRRVLPTGPRWSYSLASCLMWLLVVQVVTGFCLMTTYSPSMPSAWASVQFIERSAFGSFVRGIHYFASHAMILLFVAHVARVLISAAFRAPRELIWITGLLLIPLMMVWAITGNPLSASQKGVAQIEVEANIIGSTPIVGPPLKRLLLGGDEVGNLTLTHLYALHVGLLPFLVGLVLVLHVTQIYRHGLTPTASRGTAASRPYWPYQSVRNAAVLAGLLAVLGYLAVRFGAPLDAPADPSLTHSPRPEWYFRSLFELRRHFTGDWEFIATIVIPIATLILLLAVPMLDRYSPRRVSLVMRLAIVILGVGSFGTLTFLSFARDWQDTEYLTAVRQTELWASRSRAIAMTGEIPVEGAVSLLRNDPKTQGPLLFAKHCASCHSHANAQGEGIVAENPSAPNLYQFGSHSWIAGMLDPDCIASPHYFGKTKMAGGDMVTAIRDRFADATEEEAEETKNQLLQVARALSAEAHLRSQIESDQRDRNVIAAGRELLVGDMGCTDCHRFGDRGSLGSAPDLTGYGSREWLRAMIANPEDERFYPEGRNDRMPTFTRDPNHPSSNLLPPHELEMLVDWLRGDWYETKIPGPLGLSEQVVTR